MAHFAELSPENVVLRVLVVSSDDCRDANGVETEAAGVTFLHSLFGVDTIWKQTSYNTVAGEHRTGGTPFRKNYAGIGYTYDEARDAFIPPKPEGDWVLNEQTCQWEDV